MSDDPAARLARDIDAIAADIPHETSGFAELRNLLGLLPNPLSPLIPGSAATQLGDPAETMGGGSLQSPVSDVVGSGAQPGSQPGWDQAIASASITDAFTNLGVGVAGFGSAVRRYLTSGVYNGDFALAPRDPSAVIGAANPLPFWTFVSRSGVSISAKSVVDAASASGRILTFEMSGINGGAGDDAYIEQIVPVNGSRSNSFTYYPLAAYLGGPVIDVGVQVYFETQYLKADGVTATGTGITFTAVPLAATLAEISAITSNALVMLGLNGLVPSDALFLRLRIGMRRNTAAVTVAETLSILEVMAIGGGEQAMIAERTTPATYGPARIRAVDGAMQLLANAYAAVPGLIGPGFTQLELVNRAADAYVNAGASALILPPDTAPGTSSVLGQRIMDNVASAVLKLTDGVRAKPITPAGWQNYAWASGLPQIVAGGTVLTLPINGGSIAIPIPVTAPMVVRQYVFRQTDVAGLHTIECRLYVDLLNSGAGSATATEVAGGSATATYTPGAASSQGLVLAAPLTLGPGLYFLVIRNTSAAVTVGMQATAGMNPGVKGHAVKTLAAVLPATLDLVTGWVAAANIPEALMTGSILGEGAGGIWS